jgi:hypothetical protein
VFCEHCGTRNSQDDRFCTGCGRPMPEETAAATQPSAWAPASSAPVRQAPPEQWSTPADPRTPAATVPPAAARQQPPPGVATLPGRLRARLGNLAEARPPVSLQDGLVGIGGAIFGVAVVVFGFDRLGESGSNGVALVLTGALLAGSIAVLARGPWELEPAAVAASCIAAPGLGFALIAGDNNPSISVAAFIAAAIIAGLYFGGPSRGHTTHLVVLVVAAWLGAVALTQNSFTFDSEFDSPASIVADLGAVSLLVGACYLVAGWWLDRTGLAGMATPFLAVGAVALPIGAYAFGSDASEVGGGIIGLLAGAVVTFVGAQTQRRGTLWGGLALVAIAAFALVGAVAPDDEGATVGAVLLALAGAALAWGARYLTAWSEQLGDRIGHPVPPTASEPSGQRYNV